MEEEKKDNKNILDELVDDKPSRKKHFRNRWTPKLFAMFLFETNFLLAFSDAEYIKDYLGKKHPHLRISVQKIKKLIHDPGFDAIVDKWVDNVSEKENLKKLYYSYVKRCYDAYMDAPQPSLKLIDVLGKMSGEYDATQKVHIEGTVGLTDEDTKTISKLTEDALLNRIKRMQEKESGNN